MGPIVTAALLTVAIVLAFLLAVIAVAAVFDLPEIVGPASIVAAGAATLVYLLILRGRNRR